MHLIEISVRYILATTFPLEASQHWQRSLTAGGKPHALSLDMCFVTSSEVVASLLSQQPAQHTSHLKACLRHSTQIEQSPSFSETAEHIFDNPPVNSHGPDFSDSSFKNDTTDTVKALQ